MQFSNSALALAAVLSGSVVASAFTAPSTAFVNTRVASNSFNTVSGESHMSGCKCISCGMKTLLRMAEDAETEAPAEVVALDGVADDEEAHNAERPARDSGLKKHKTKGKGGTPVSELVIGSFVDGTVKSITSYGAFVDIGARTDALLHVSRLSDSFVSNVEDIVKAGDKVSVRIVSVDAEKGQVAISMLSEEAEQKVTNARAANSGGRRKERPQRSQGDKNAQAQTLNALAEKGFNTSKFVEGQVVSTLAFGAFVRFSVADLAEGIEGELDGLVHISALSTQRTNNVEDVCKVGDKVQVRVRDIDTDGNKVSLSLITVEEEEANRPQRGEKKQRRGKEMFSADEMGPADWKEQLDTFDKDQDTFTNMPIIVDNRKSAVSA